VFGPKHPRVAESDHFLGEAFIAAGDTDSARVALMRAHALREELLGSDHPMTRETATLLAGLQ